MGKFDNDWKCFDCGVLQSKHNQWFDGDICGVCHDEQENNKKKDEVESILIMMWKTIGMDIPENFEDIVQYCFEDVCDTADPVDWHSGDVSIAFRRWIEEQSKEVEN